MKQSTDIITSRVKEVLLELDLSRTEIATRYDVSIQTVHFWMINRMLPPIHSLILISRDSGHSIEYILGRTSEDHKNDSFEMRPRIYELMNEFNLDVSALAKRCNTNLTLLKKTLDANFTKCRTGTIALYADTFGVTVDYFLGLTSYRPYRPIVQKTPFEGIPAGSAVLVETPQNQTCFVLLHTDGIHVISANGQVKRKDDPLFYEVTVTQLTPTRGRKK